MRKAACTIKISFLFAALLIGALAYAQKAKRAATKPKRVAEPTREKFDPARDPEKDLAAATVKAQKENKRIILAIGGEWCGWCVEMDEYFSKNPALLKMRDSAFIWVKVNMSPANENKAFLSKYPKIDGYPHLFVLESDGTLLTSQSTDVLEEEKPEPKVVKRNAAGEAVLIDLGESTYDLYLMVEFLKKWTKASPH